MKQTRTDLNQLFSALRADVPTVRSGELRELLQSAEVPHSNVINQSTQFKKKKLLMNTILLLALLGTSIYIGLHANTSNETSTVLRADIPNPQATILNINDSNRLSINRSEPVSKQNQFDSFKIALFNKATIIPDMVHTISEKEIVKLGIHMAASGMIILDDDYRSQLEFPTDTFARFGEHISTPEQVPFELFPQFVTDTKGNLVMMAERKQVGRESKITLVADMSVTVPKRNYYRTESMSTHTIMIDSSVSPAIITDKCRFSIGIMSLDTTINYRVGFEQEKRLIIHSIQERLTVKDSSYKAAFGGERGLSATFGNAFGQSTLTLAQRRIINNLDSIANLLISELEQTKLQFAFLNEKTTSTEYSPIERLQIEQLSRTYDYKYYRLQHQADETTVSQINNFVPVLIRTANGSLPNPTYNNGLIFWYKPSPDFYAAVPSLQQTSSTIADTRLETVKIFPNPCSSLLYIDCARRTSVTIELRDLLGHAIIEKIQYHPSSVQPFQLDVSFLTPGMYFLILKNNEGKTEISRVIVQR